MCIPGPITILSIIFLNDFERKMIPGVGSLRTVFLTNAFESIPPAKIILVASISPREESIENSFPFFIFEAKYSHGKEILPPYIKIFFVSSSIAASVSIAPSDFEKIILLLSPKVIDGSSLLACLLLITSTGVYFLYPISFSNFTNESLSISLSSNHSKEPLHFIFKLTSFDRTL